MVVAMGMAGCIVMARMPARSFSQKLSSAGATAAAASRNRNALTAAGGSSSGSSWKADRVCSKPEISSVHPGQECRCASNRSTELESSSW